MVHLANRYQYLDINVIAKCELGIQGKITFKMVMLLL